MLKEYLARGFRYDTWANRRTLAALKQIAAPDQRTLAVMAHLLMAQKVWWTRLRGEDSSGLAIWPELTLAECDALMDENEKAGQQFFALLSAEQLPEEITYQMSNGTQRQTAIVDILTHVMLHGSYHRGQLAVAIRRQGGEVPMTDYFIFAME